MILTDIYIPAVDGNYDFMLDENVPVVQIMEEICEMIAKKVKENKPGSISDFVLYARDFNTMLDLNRSLFENGIRDGCSLILV